MSDVPLSHPETESSTPNQVLLPMYLLLSVNSSMLFEIAAARVYMYCNQRQNDRIPFSRFLLRSSLLGGYHVIRNEAGPFCRASSSVRLRWELEEPKGPKGSPSRRSTRTTSCTWPSRQ